MKKKIAESIATELAASEAKRKVGGAEEQKVSSEDAAAVSQQLYSLINAHFGNALDSEYDEDQSSAAQDGAAEEDASDTAQAEEDASDTAQAEDVAVADAEEVTQDEEVASLTEDQCVELQSQKKFRCLR